MMSSRTGNLGKFLLKKKLGEGGMGEVWLARDAELEREIALKFLKGGDEDQIARFMREAQTTSKLIHPNIAAVYEVGSEGGRHYIAMQFVPGKTLKGFPTGMSRIAAKIIRDAARALQFAHDNGIIHRDIKPDNIMITSATMEKDQHVYVMDFGLARPIKGKSTLSVSGVVVGTPSYMSPEQSKGEKLDATTDIYSLGATLYEMLAGHKPFIGKTIFEVLKKLQEEDPKPIMNAEQDLVTITMKCLEKDRKLRYQSAAALADDLDRWLNDEPILAHAPSISYRAKKYARKHRGGLAMAASAFCVGLAFLAIFIGDQRTKTNLTKAKAEADQKAEVERKQKETARRQKAEAEAKAAAETKRAEAEALEKTIHETKQKASDAFLLGDFKKSVDLYSEVIRLDPKSWYAYLSRADCKSRLWDTEGSLADCNKAIEIEASAQAYSQRGYILWQLKKDLAAALADFNKAIELNPKVMEAYVNRALVLNERGDREHAVADLEYVLTQAPENWPHRRDTERYLRAIRGR